MSKSEIIDALKAHLADTDARHSPVILTILEALLLDAEPAPAAPADPVKDLETHV